MTTRRLLAVALLTSGLIGCGDDGPRLRTELSCLANDDAACGSTQSDVPVRMWCNAGFHEVDSCPTADVLATCTIYDGPFYVEVRVYDATALDAYEYDCYEAGGDWTEYPLVQE